MNKLGSIERFLLIFISVVFVVYVSATYLLSKSQTKHEMDEIFDPQLAHSAFLLFDLLGESVANIDQSSTGLPIIYHNFYGNNASKKSTIQNQNQVNNQNIHQYNSKGSKGSNQENEPPANNHQPEDTDFIYENKFAYQVFNGAGKLLIKSSSAPDAPFSNHTLGFSSIVINQASWRVYALHDKALDYWLYVAEDESLREEITAEISAQIPFPALLISPFFFILTILCIRIALAPLKQLVVSINERDVDSLDTIELTTLPKELSPVVSSINALIVRLEDALTREKRLTADTAHELRTPLSVVLIHAQNALNNHSEQERSTALKALDKGVKRVARLLEQLLTLSKINPDTMPMSSINLYQLTQQVSAELALKIIQKNQEISLHCDNKTQQVSCKGNDFLLEILLRNLIENASQYTPEGGTIKLTIVNDDEHILLSVEDSGIGVSPTFYSKITERFYRQQQNQGQGAGLGLTLVNNITEYHQGSLKFQQSSLGGLLVNITLLKQ